VHLGEQGVIEIICSDKGGLLGGRDLWGLSGRCGLPGEQAFVGAIAKLP
jgi:hypothetical protein